MKFRGFTTIVIIVVALMMSFQPSYAHPTPQVIKITQTVTPGFYEGQQVFYYTFFNGTPILSGGTEVAVGQQYRLVDADSQLIQGQSDLIAAGPYDKGYSDLREIIEITVPDDYEVNSITSVEDLLAQNWPQNPTGKLHNSPIVRTGTQLQGHDYDPLSIWINGEEHQAFDFGETPAQSAPIWVLITGYDATGSAVRLPGQAGPIIRQLQSDPGYSDFWRVYFVTVPEDTVPNSLRSYEQIIASGYPIEASENVINCPVIRAENMAIGYLNDAAYYITRIDRPDLPLDENLPPIYTYVYDDGVPLPDTPWVLSVGEGDDGYTGFCMRTHVLLASGYHTSETALLNDPNANLQPVGVVSTCAILMLKN
ncbi:MAG: hypothetical protein HY862_13535 [Chloroflexi bacterium]|nr:hypothetical protein [Chloroflexota bacterium]